MKTVQLEEILNIISKLQHLLERLPEGSGEYNEMLVLISRAEKQRDKLYRLEQQGEDFLQAVREFLND